MSDQEFLNIIYMHWVLNTNVLMRMGGVETALDDIRKLIDTELSR